MIRIERLRSDGSRERADLVTTDCGMVYIFPAQIPLSARRTGRGWYSHRVGYIIRECDLSYTVRNIGNRIVHELLEDRLEALAMIAASEGFRITALGRPDQLLDMKLQVSLTRHARPRQYATLSCTSGAVYLFPERIPAKQRRLRSGCGEVFVGSVRRTTLGWDIEVEGGSLGGTYRESRLDAIRELLRLSPLVRTPETDAPTIPAAEQSATRTRVLAEPAITPAAAVTAARTDSPTLLLRPPRTERPRQSLYA